MLDTTLHKTYTNNVNKTWAFLQTIRDKDEPNIVDITTIFRTIDFLTDIAFRFWWMSRWLVLYITVAVLWFLGLLLCAVCRTIDFLANIVNFPFIPSTVQQHLYIDYIYLSWYDIPDLVVPFIISLIAAYKEATEPSHHLVERCGISVISSFMPYHRVCN